MMVHDELMLMSNDELKLMIMFNDESDVTPTAKAAATTVTVTAKCSDYKSFIIPIAAKSAVDLLTQLFLFSLLIAVHLCVDRHPI